MKNTEKEKKKRKLKSIWYNKNKKKPCTWVFFVNLFLPQYSFGKKISVDLGPTNVP